MTTNESAPDPTAGGEWVEEPDDAPPRQDAYEWEPVRVPATPDADDRLITCPECRSTFEAEDGSLVSTPPADDASIEASEPLTEAERAMGVYAYTSPASALVYHHEDVERIKAAAATKARADERERIAQAIARERTDASGVTDNWSAGYRAGLERGQRIATGEVLA